MSKTTKNTSSFDAESFIQNRLSNSPTAEVVDIGLFYNPVETLTETRDSEIFDHHYSTDSWEISLLAFAVHPTTEKTIEDFERWNNNGRIDGEEYTEFQSWVETHAEDVTRTIFTYRKNATFNLQNTYDKRYSQIFRQLSIAITVSTPFSGPRVFFAPFEPNAETIQPLLEETLELTEKPVNLREVPSFTSDTETEVQSAIRPNTVAPVYTVKDDTEIRLHRDENNYALSIPNTETNTDPIWNMASVNFTTLYLFKSASSPLQKFDYEILQSYDSEFTAKKTVSVHKLKSHGNLEFTFFGETFEFSDPLVWNKEDPLTEMFENATVTENDRITVPIAFTSRTEHQKNKDNSLRQDAQEDETEREHKLITDTWGDWIVQPTDEPNAQKKQPNEEIETEPKKPQSLTERLANKFF